MSAEQTVLWFQDPGCEEVLVAGGKGAGLARMARLGLPIPPGFVVPASSLGETLKAAGLLEGARSLLATGAESHVAQLQAMVQAMEVPGSLAQVIGEAYASMGEDAPVAVRSSASAEDSEVASFAGQQDTFLNVRGGPSVVTAVRACWASFFSERAIFYRRSKGSLEDLAMAVVVQRQLRPEKSGVMFTVDPVHRRRDQMLIEAVFGLGEAVVSGRVTPDQYLTSRDGTVKRAQVATQAVEVVLSEGSGVEERPLTLEQGGRRVLEDSELASLADLGRLLETSFGRPQDVEWAFEAGLLYLLQSRPVTA